MGRSWYSLWSRRRLLTRETYALMKLCSLYSYVGGVPLKWNQDELSVEMREGKWVKLYAQVMQIFSVTYALVVSIAFVLHGYESGFDVTSKYGGIRTITWLTGFLSVLFIFTTTIDSQDIMSLLNAMVYTCNDYEAHQRQRIEDSPKRIHMGNMAYVVIGLGMIELPILFALCYAWNCRFHVLYEIIPDVVCAHRLAANNPNPDFGIPYLTVVGIFIAMFLYQWSVLGTYFGAIGSFAMFLCPVPFAFFEISKNMMTLDISAPEYKNCLRTFKYMQLTAVMFNSSNFTYTAAWHVIFLYAIVVIAVQIVVSMVAGPVLISAGILYIIVMSFHFIFFLRMIWRASEATDNFLDRMKTRQGNTRADRALLKTLQPFRLRFGFMGYFDRSLYIFLYMLIMDMIINVLLM